MFYTAIIMGLAGSLHCGTMCGPLAMAITKNKPFLQSSILYNSGRVFLYSLFGVFAGAFGSFLHLYTYQQFLSIALGGAFLLAGLNVFNLRLPYLNQAITVFTSQLKKLFGKISNQKSGSTTFLLGMLNGTLPCGLTYFALSACLILPTATDGFLFMFYFGLGTWPVMIGAAKLFILAKIRGHISFAIASRISLLLIGFLLIFRVWMIHPHSSDKLLVKSIDGIQDCK